LGDPENNKQLQKRQYTNVGVAVFGDPKKNKNYNVGAGLASAHAITLITLVITIVILILLASITINLALKDNGLFSKTKQSKEETIIASEKEQLQLAILSALTNSEYNLTTNAIEQEIKNVNLTGEIILGDGYWIYKGEKNYLIDANGKIWSSMAKYIKENAKFFYGKYVKNFENNDSVINKYNWRIFYSDNENIYLISEDYIDSSDWPLGRLGTSPKCQGVYGGISLAECAAIDYRVVDGDSVSVYWQDIDIARKNLSLLNTTLEDKVYDSVCATAYLLDTKVWTEKFNSEFIYYAMGTPTLDIFVKSLNDVNDKNDQLELDELYNRYNTQFKIQENLRNLYCNTKYGYLLLATPSLYNSSNVSTEAGWNWFSSVFLVKVDNSGQVFRGYYYGDAVRGNMYARTIICLKSDVLLEKSNDADNCFNLIM
jgi:type II secretory pathway pseudopilin PulG